MTSQITINEYSLSLSNNINIILLPTSLICSKCCTKLKHFISTCSAINLNCNPLNIIALHSLYYPYLYLYFLITLFSNARASLFTYIFIIHYFLYILFKLYAMYMKNMYIYVHT